MCFCVYSVLRCFLICVMKIKGKDLGCFNFSLIKNVENFEIEINGKEIFSESFLSGNFL